MVSSLNLNIIIDGGNQKIPIFRKEDEIKVQTKVLVDVKLPEDFIHQESSDLINKLILKSKHIIPIELNQLYLYFSIK